jgi:hypothetical protein
MQIFSIFSLSPPWNKTGRAPVHKTRRFRANPHPSLVASHPWVQARLDVSFPRRYAWSSLLTRECSPVCLRSHLSVLRPKRSDAVSSSLTALLHSRKPRPRLSNRAAGKLHLSTTPAFGSAGLSTSGLFWMRLCTQPWINLPVISESLLWCAAQVGDARGVVSTGHSAWWGICVFGWIKPTRISWCKTRCPFIPSLSCTHFLKKPTRNGQNTGW